MPYNLNNPNSLRKYREYHKAYRQRPEVKAKKERGTSIRTYKLRQEILTLLGMKCQKCGYNTDIRALQIDHVNGGGRKECAKFPSICSWYKFILQEVKSGSKNYQCLCANCNRIKVYENRECCRWVG